MEDLSIYNEFEFLANSMRHNDTKRVTKTKILDRINLLRAKLEKVFITNNLKTNEDIVNLSRELDEVIIVYHRLSEDRVI